MREEERQEYIDDLRICEQQRQETNRQLMLKTTSEEKLLREVSDLRDYSDNVDDLLTKSEEYARELEEEVLGMKLFMETVPTHQAFNAKNVLEIYNAWKDLGWVKRQYDKEMHLRHALGIEDRT